MFFVSSNIDASMMLKQQKPKKTKKKKAAEWGNIYTSLWDEPAEKEDAPE